jgi:hypothetical protein
MASLVPYLLKQEIAKKQRSGHLNKILVRFEQVVHLFLPKVRGKLMLTGLARRVQHMKFLVSDNSGTILTGMGVSGTIATAYLTGRASFKAAQLIQQEEQELEREYKNDLRDSRGLTPVSKVKLTWRLYIPPVGVGVTTIVCIISANKLASKRIAALAVASGISERALQEYKTKVIDKLGERQDQKLRDEIAQDRVNGQPVQREVILAGTGEVLCYDMLTGRYFQSTVEEIKRAENKINHDLNNFMSASLSEFYDELGLPPTTFSDSVGWNANRHVEVVFSTVMSTDQRPCIAIDFANPPVAEYRNVYD